MLKQHKALGYGRLVGGQLTAAVVGSADSVMTGDKNT